MRKLPTVKDYAILETDWYTSISTYELINNKVHGSSTDLSVR